LWNGKDSILKERLLGLTNAEGNHGEDVKEYYFYLDSTPTHSYMKYLYKYPQAAYPYADLVEKNGNRSRHEMEYELLDTGVFNEDRYFDVFVEYAKAAPEDILVQITVANRGIVALLNEDKLRRILTRMLDENEFLSPFGIRALPRAHLDHPFVFHVHGEEFRGDYLPAESDNSMFGGNSNWRGPIWMPVNGLIIKALMQFYLNYGDNFKIECPTGSGNLMNLFEVSREIGNRLSRIFLRDERGRGPAKPNTSSRIRPPLCCKLPSMIFT
jgi:hypothetical protein